MIDYYHILGVQENASLEEIKQAYRKLSLKFHPDKNDNDAYFSEMFKRVAEAYEVLSNPIKKEAYNEALNKTKTDRKEDELFNDDELDPIFVEVAAFFILQKKANSSMLQREFRVDFHRATAIMRQLEDEGIIGPYKDTFREVLVDKHYIEEQYNYNFSEARHTSEQTQSKNDKKQSTQTDNFSEIVESSRKKERIRRKLMRWSIMLVVTLIILYTFKDTLGDKLTEINRTYFNQNSLSGTVVAPLGLNMRINPSSNANIITRIPNESQLLIISEQGPQETISGKTAPWYKVLYENKEGWVWGGYIQKD
jgi:curved DNA-binding protein CbpA